MAAHIRRAAGPASADPHVAGKARKQNTPSGRLLSAGVTLGSIALDQGPWPGFGVSHRQVPDNLGADPGDGFCPLGSLWNPVLFPCKIRQIALGRVDALWHVLPVKAHTAPVQKFLVLKALLHDHIGHGIHHGAVRGRADGNPLGSKPENRVVLSGIHHHDGDLLFSGFLKIIHGSAVEFCFCRVVSPQDDQIGVKPVLQAAASLAGAVHQLRGRTDASGAVGIVIVQESPVQAQKPFGKAAASQDSADPCGVVHIPGPWAVGIPYPDPLRGNGVHRLLPGDPLKASLSPLSHPFHGVLKPVLPKKCLVVIQPPDTGSKRHTFPRILPGIGDQLFNPSIPHPGMDHTTSAAVVPPCGVDNSDFLMMTH